MWEISWNSVDVKMPKMHYKTWKISKISLDEKLMSKTAHGMLEFIRIYFPTNCHAYMMNIGQIITKKRNKLRQYANELLGENC